MAFALLNALRMKKLIIILIGACTLGLTLSGCGSKGMFTPYTDGSILAQGTPEEADLRVSYDAPNELFHQPRYDLTVAAKDTGRSLRLGFIMDGDFLAPTKDTVQVTASGKDGMTVKTNDLLLQGLIDHVSISLKKTALKTARTFDLEILLYDDANRLVGRFTDNLAEATSATAGEADPTSPSAIYDWIATRAKITASN